MSVARVGGTLPLFPMTLIVHPVWTHTHKEPFNPFCAYLGLSAGEKAMVGAETLFPPPPTFPPLGLRGTLGSLLAAPLPLTESFLYLASEPRGWGTTPLRLHF